MDIFRSVFDRQELASDFLGVCSEAVGAVAEQLATNERVYEAASSGLERLVYRCLELVAGKFRLATDCVQKIAFIFRVYSGK